MGRLGGIVALGLAVAAAAFGLGAGADVALAWLIGVEAWLFGAVAYPSLFLVLLGFGVGAFALPGLLAWARRRRAGQDFRQRLAALEGREAKTLLDLANAAYDAWWADKTELPDHPELPATLDDLVARGKPARWAKLASGDMEDVESEMFFANPILWEFATTLAGAVARGLAGNGGAELLKTDECVRFHQARLTLAGFWDGVGERVFATRALPYAAVAPALDSGAFRVLTFVEAAVAKQRGEATVARHLPRLGAEPRFWEAPFRARPAPAAPAATESAAPGATESAAPGETETAAPPTAEDKPAQAE